MDRTTTAWWTRAAWRVAMIVLVALATGCSHGAAGGGDEGTVAVSASAALSSADVAKVTVTITAPDIATPIVANLAKVGGQWQGLIGHIPVGTGRNFHGDAYDASNAVVYRGDAPNVTITKNATTAVALLLQQTAPAVPFANAAPIIDSLVASTNAPGVGDAVTLGVTAHDPNAGDTLAYAWSATAGSYAPANAASTTWTAPATTGAQTLTIQVSDPKGATAGMSFAVNVGAGQGGAMVTTTFNTFPTVANVTATPTPIDVGQTTTATATASDADGDALSYAWSSDCAGTFGAPSSATTPFTLSTLPASGSCTLTVNVNDGRGGADTGAITFSVGPGATTTLAPVVDGSFQSSTSAAPGDTVTFRVTAHDPSASPLSFQWYAAIGSTSYAGGSVGNTVSDASSSELTWIAPATFTSGHADITVFVHDGLGLGTWLNFDPVVAASLARADAPVAPTTGNWMWQGQQVAFKTSTGAPCNARIALGVGDQAACFTGADGAMRCAGSIYTNTYGPSAFVPAGPMGVDQILVSPTFNSATGNAVCTHLTSGEAECMGDFDAWGQFGTGNTGPSATFVSWGRSGLTAIGSGTWDQLCALDSQGSVYCSGYSFGATPTLVGNAGANGSFWVTPFGTARIDDASLLRAGESRTECVVTSSGLTCNGVNVGTAGSVVSGGYVQNLPGTTAPPNSCRNGLMAPVCWLDSTGAVSCEACDVSGNLQPPQPYFGGHVLALGLNFYGRVLCAVMNDGSVSCLGSSQSGALVAPSAPANSVSTTCP